MRKTMDLNTVFRQQMGAWPPPQTIPYNWIKNAEQAREHATSLPRPRNIEEARLIERGQMIVSSIYAC